ncbi:MAG: hypothetical protein WBZ00_01455 [Solirubrobacterales bacterium]
MRWLKHTVSFLLLVAAVAVTLGTVFSNHSDDYGKVPLPQGGVVHLPQGEVVVFYRQAGGGSDGGPAAPLTFQVMRVADGAPVPVSADNGATIANADQRSETIGELGAVAKLDVPSAGSYVVSAGGAGAPETSSLEFGTNAGSALAKHWRLLAGLLGAAILVALIPVPRSKRRWEDPSGPASGWSSNPRAPYAG